VAEYNKEEYEKTIEKLMNILHPNKKTSLDEARRWKKDHLCLSNNLIEILELSQQKQIDAIQNGKNISEVDLLRESINETRAKELMTILFKNNVESGNNRYNEILEHLQTNLDQIDELTEKIMFEDIKLKTDYAALIKNSQQEDFYKNIQKIALDISLKKSGIKGIIDSNELDYSQQSVIENITEEQLQEILEQIVIPGSSIGVHSIDTNDTGLQIYDSILKEGLRINKSYGLVGTISFENPIEQFNAYNITSYEHGMDKNNIINNVIVAIPETGYINEEQYYIGQFFKYNGGYGKNDERANSIPLNWIKENLPKELIVGLYINDTTTGKRSLIINPDYISFKSETEQQEFSKKLFSMADHYVFNDSDYMVAQMYPNPSPYEESFIKKYEEITQGPKHI